MKGTMIEASLNWTDKDRFVGTASSRHSIEMDAGTEKTALQPDGVSAARFVRLHGVGRGGNSPQETRAIHRARSAGTGRKSGRLSRRLHVDSFDLSRSWAGVAESHGRRGAALERKVLLGFRDAGED